MAKVAPNAKTAKKAAKIAAAAPSDEKRLYEALMLYKPTLDLDSVDNTLSNLEKVMIEPLGGNIRKVDKVGRKRLAYDITRFRDAFTMLVYFELPPSQLKELRRQLNIQEDLLRATIIRLENEDALTAPSAVMAAPMGRPMMRDQQQGSFQGPRPQQQQAPAPQAVAVEDAE